MSCTPFRHLSGGTGATSTSTATMRAVPLGVAAGLALSAASGTALSAYDPLRPLGQVQGLSELQQRTGDAVQAVCGAFINEGVDESRADVAEQRVLFDKCGEMVNTANRLRGAEAGTGKDLGITAEELGAALQNVAAEEIAATGSLATESSSQQSASVARRLSSVLSQSSTLQVSSASLLGGTQLALLDAEVSLGGGAAVPSGGGAAADGEIVNRLGVYVNALGAFAEKVSTESEDGFEADSAGVSVGVDYLFGSNLLAGVNVGYVNTSTEFDTTADVSGGDMDSSQVNASLYGMWFGDAGYLDVLAGFGSGTFDLERSILIQSAPDAQEPDTGNPNDGLDDTAFGETDSSSVRFGLGGGLEISSGPLTFAPFARLSYLAVELDGYTENGSALALRVDDQSIDSLTTGFGLRLVGTYSGSRAVVSPQFNVELVQELMDDSRQIVSTYVHDPRNLPLVTVTDDPDRTYYSVGFGASAVFAGGVQLFGEARSLLDLDSLDEFSLSGGLRFEF